LQHFTYDRPTVSVTCADTDCDCGREPMAEGEGFLFISVQVERDRGPDGSGTAEPMLLCEQAARRRDLDLEVAAEDAANWWKTGRAPLRATPKRQIKFREAKAKTAEEAQERARASVTTGRLLGVELVKDVQSRSAAGNGATAEAAKEAAASRMPEDAFDVQPMRIIQEGGSGAIQVEASNEMDAKAALRKQAPRSAQIDSLECKSPPKLGVLGLGKKPGAWVAKWSAPFVAEVEYKVPAVARARYMP